MPAPTSISGTMAAMALIDAIASRSEACTQSAIPPARSALATGTAVLESLKVTTGTTPSRPRSSNTESSPRRRLLISLAGS